MAKKKKKVSNKTKIMITVIALALVIMVVLCIMLYKSTKQEDTLKSEIYTLLNSDITSYSYDNKTKTNGNYAVIERSIKEYIAQYASVASKIDTIKTDKTFTSILSADNYTNDGKDFNNSITYITNAEKTINDTLKKLETMTQEKRIMKKIDNKKLSNYYITLYKELMLSTPATTAFKNGYKSTKVTADAIKNVLSVQKDVLNLLKDNKDKWDVKDGKIVFKKSDLLTSYNDIVNRIPK